MPSRKPKPRRAAQTVSKSLKGFTDARKPAIDLLRDIKTHVVAQGVKNADEGREGHKIHVSELVKDPCPRFLHYKVTKAERTNATSPAYHQLEMIWAAGSQEHLKWQQWLREMGDLWGTWKCLVCNTTWEGPSPDVCGAVVDDEICYSTLIEYKEVNLADPEYPLVGHADGAVPRLNALVEIKSFSVGSVRVEDASRLKEHTYKVDGKTLIDQDGLWKSIKRPLRTHLQQGLMYLWMARRQGLPYDKVVFIYENKTTQATRTFEVKYSERFIEEQISLLQEMAVHAEVGLVPERPKLFVKDAKPCNTCPFRDLCWDGESSGTQETSDVPSRRSRTRSEASGREAEVQSARPTRRRDPESPRRRRRTERPSSDEPDDRVHEVGRASRRPTRAGGGGRAVGRGADGDSQGPRFARKSQGRNRA